MLMPPPQQAGAALPGPASAARGGAAVQRQASLLTQPGPVLLRTEPDDHGVATGATGFSASSTSCTCHAT